MHILNNINLWCWTPPPSSTNNALHYLGDYNHLCLQNVTPWFHIKRSMFKKSCMNKNTLELINKPGKETLKEYTGF